MYSVCARIQISQLPQFKQRHTWMYVCMCVFVCVGSEQRKQQNKCPSLKRIRCYLAVDIIYAR